MGLRTLGSSGNILPFLILKHYFWLSQNHFFTQMTGDKILDKYDMSMYGIAFGLLNMYVYRIMDLHKYLA